MNFQYFDTLLDKSDEIVLYYVKQIAPGFTKGELTIFLSDITGKGVSGSKSVFIEIGEDYDTVADLSKLNSDQLAILYKIFISKELNDKKSVKWRFYQYTKIIRDFIFESIKLNVQDELIDFIIELEDGRIFIVACLSTMKLDDYGKIISSFIEFAKKENVILDKAIIAVNKTFRNIPITESFNIDDKSIVPELWVEWIEINKSFNGEDLITAIINNNERIETAGFNFSSTQDLLDYVYENSNGGQISIFKQRGFFSEAIQEEQQVELIWKGIMIKT